MSDLAAAKALITKHEGKRSTTYDDSLGIPTIGVGFNLQRADARIRIAAVGANYGALLIRSAGLTDKQIDDLLTFDVEDCIRDLQGYLPGFDEMPEEARLVLIDLRFNLGPTRLRQFTSTLAAFAAGKYKKAAKFLEATLWARQVGARAREDIALLRRLPNGDHE